MTFKEALSRYESRLKEIFEYCNADEIIEGSDKLEDLLDGLSSVTTVKEIRAVANNLKGSEGNG